jgi:hypothetical protein
MIMLGRGILLVVMCLTVTTALRGAEIIEADKLDKAQLLQAIQAASDDTVMEFQGVRKTKAQWRSDFQAQHKPPDAAQLRQMADQLQAKFDAAAKALQEKQDRDIAEQNAKITKEFNSLTAR